MKFLAFALVAITGVSAASTTAAPPVVSPADGDPNCLANYIVRQCLFTETAKVLDPNPLTSPHTVMLILMPAGKM
jgi:hypothetical protein